MEETYDELRLVLAMIRTDLEKSSTESLGSDEVNKKIETEQKL